jgi:muramoyltetrapeptide carboxypeptidase LdcA involved in peptidoglycan recycling
MLTANAMIIPRALRPGDTVAVVAPSSPFEAVLGWRGLGFLATRYRLKFDRDLFSREGYLAGNDARRKNELKEALEDPSVSAILAARGGYGASRFAHDLDFSVLRERPKWIIGFSDVTTLHVEATRIGVASLHAPHLTSLWRSDEKLRRSMVLALEDPLRSRVLNVAGVLLGQFTGCDPGADRVTTIQVLEERLGILKVPILDGLPSGHGAHNEPLVIGGQARIGSNGSEGYVELG